MVTRIPGPYHRPTPETQCQFPAEELHEMKVLGRRTSYNRKRTADPRFCFRTAHIVLDGFRFCPAHAGHILLCRALNEPVRGPAARPAPTTPQTP